MGRAWFPPHLSTLIQNIKQSKKTRFWDSKKGEERCCDAMLNFSFWFFQFCFSFRIVAQLQKKGQMVLLLIPAIKEATSWGGGEG